MSAIGLATTLMDVNIHEQKLCSLSGTGSPSVPIKISFCTPKLLNVALKRAFLLLKNIKTFIFIIHFNTIVNYVGYFKGRQISRSLRGTTVSVSFAQNSSPIILNHLRDVRKTTPLDLQSWTKVLGQICICGVFSHAPNEQPGANSSTYVLPLPRPPLQCWTRVRAISLEVQHCMEGAGGGGGGGKQRILKRKTVLF